MKVFFYGRLMDAAGTSQREVNLPPEITDALALRAWLGADDPALLTVLGDPSVRIIVNDELATGNPALRQEDEVTFFPPVSGG